MNQNLFKLLMFINNIEIKIDSQVCTPMGCMISPPAYDNLIFSKIIPFIIVQPNVEELSTNPQELQTRRSYKPAGTTISATYSSQPTAASIAVQLLSTIISASSAAGSLKLLDCLCFIIILHTIENFIRFILIIKFIFLNLRTGYV